MASHIRRYKGQFSVSPHLPFEMNLEVLDALTNNRHVSALLHGEAYMQNMSNGVYDPKLQSGTDAAGGKLQLLEQYNSGYTHVPNTHSDYPFGGECRQRRLRMGWWPNPGGQNGRFGPTGWYTRDQMQGFQGMREAGFTGIVNELYRMADPQGSITNDAWTSALGVQNFYVYPQLDCASLAGSLSTNTPTAIANWLAPRMLANSRTYKNSSGRYIIGAFNPKKGTAVGLNEAWFSSFFTAMQNAGAPSALMPFASGDWSSAYIAGSPAAAISGGPIQFAQLGGAGGSWVGDFGMDTVGTVSGQGSKMNGVRSISTASQKLNYCFTPQFQDCRPRKGWFNEAEGLKLVYTAGEYMFANGRDGDHAHWLTFNDEAERAIAPGTGRQYVTMDIAAYYNWCFRTGARPPIVRDVIYGAHRMHAWNAMPGPAQVGDGTGLWATATVETNGSRRMQAKDNTGKNIISMLAFCKDACTVRILDPDHSTVLATHDVTASEAAAGPYLLQYEGTLPAGYPYFQLIRSGDLLIDMKSDYRIRSSITRFQNLEYRLLGSGRRSLGLLATTHPNIEPVELTQDDGNVLPCDPRYGSSG